MFTAKFSGKSRGLLYAPNAHPTPPIVTILHQHGTFVVISEPTLTHYHPKSTVYIRVHSWWCTFYRFGHMYNAMYPALLYHTEEFQCPKNPLSSAWSSCHPPRLWHHWPLYCLHSFALSSMLYSWNNTGRSLFQTGFSYLVIRI